MNYRFCILDYSSKYDDLLIEERTGIEMRNLMIIAHETHELHERKKEFLLFFARFEYFVGVNS